VLLILDNYDSFTYNPVQYFGELGCEPIFRRNDAISVDEIARPETGTYLHLPDRETHRRGNKQGSRAPVAPERRCSVFALVTNASRKFWRTGCPRGAVNAWQTSEIHHDGSGVFADCRILFRHALSFAHRRAGDSA
jgi:hypothetical protein